MCSRICVSGPPADGTGMVFRGSRTCFSGIGFRINLSPTALTVSLSPRVNRSRILLLSALYPTPELQFKERGTQMFANYSKFIKFDETIAAPRQCQGQNTSGMTKQLAGILPRCPDLIRCVGQQLIHFCESSFVFIGPERVCATNLLGECHQYDVSSMFLGKCGCA